jgi:hypothetical protein
MLGVYYFTQSKGTDSCRIVFTTQLAVDSTGREDNNHGAKTMNFTTRINRLLKSTGIKIEATWIHALGRFDVWATYHNGYEVKETFLNGITRDAEAAAIEIVDRVLEWESR